MKVGVFVDVGDEGRGVPAYPEIRARARQAEALGLDSIWVADHLVFRFDGATLGTHECWTVLAALAEATERITLGTMVICTSFRNPALLAKMAATLDHVSGGRLVLGLGCGWHDPEYEAFGFPADRKVDRFEEAIGIVSALVRTGRADVEGQWTQLRDCVLVVEAHDGPELPVTAILHERFGGTHVIEEIAAEPRYVDDFPLLGDLPQVTVSASVWASDELAVEEPWHQSETATPDTLADTVFSFSLSVVGPASAARPATVTVDLLGNNRYLATLRFSFPCR